MKNRNTILLVLFFAILIVVSLITIISRGKNPKEVYMAQPTTTLSGGVVSSKSPSFMEY